jgi:hypothetical protein
MITIHEPKEVIKAEQLLQVGDILIDDSLGIYILRKTNDDKYIFRSPEKEWGGFNGQFDSLVEMTKSTLLRIKQKEGKVRLYRASEWELQLVPKQ